MSDKYQLSCKCNNVHFELIGKPKSVFVCHCSTCRKMHGAPMNYIMMYEKKDIHHHVEESSLMSYPTSDHITRYSCVVCGASVFNHLAYPNMPELMSTFVGLAQDKKQLDFDLTPTCHIYYDERVMNVCDGIVKFKDASKEFGGSGVVVDDKGNERKQ